MTTAPAAYLGRVGRMGAVAPGMDADVLLLATATVQSGLLRDVAGAGLLATTIE
ncbi:hypothetical protein SK854_35320 [Lentzea sp. BCCO 10_0061]|uniref:N-acetylglucosamine-6-phosphate deacetylase n=1 Tax=Lentzea sokolovensis TaxID=3095429 RepID=A0ABU4V6K6_9PSEU|nr:hypothetical protein [Lentzea sp. BCCO 10_0061]MDX8147426.1 hypothetical protein [Lentzea sp. BCCO 10_0061]